MQILFLCLFLHKIKHMSNKTIKNPKVQKGFSNRIYPPRICLQCKEKFTPTDARQVYCCEQHRIDFNNDKTKAILKYDKVLIKGIKHNYEVLSKIKNSPFYLQNGKFNRSLLDYEGFDFSQYHKKVINKQTNAEILICYDLGIECTNIALK